MGLLAIAMVCCACAAAPQGKVPGTAKSPYIETGPFKRPTADAVAMHEGLAWLSLPDRPVDYAKARETFQTLIRDYPDSKWRTTAQVFIRLIDALQAANAQLQSAQTKGRADQELAEKMNEENVQLKKEIRELSDRCRTEQASLLQHNEQLRKDLDLLKKLEIQMDRREKMLR